MRRLLILAALSLFLNACSTDVEVNAPFTERPVIYALLDPAQGGRQLVRVQRSFLNIAEPSAQAIAGEKDSIYYRPEQISVQLIAVRGNGQETAYTLHDTLTTEKDSGTFYGPDQRIYVTTPGTPALTTSFTYKIRVKVNATSKTAEASTKIIPALALGDLISPQLSDGERELTYSTRRASVSYNIGPNVARTQAQIVFDFTETLTDGTTRPKRAVYTLGPDYTVTTGTARRVDRPSSNPPAYELFESLRRQLDTSGTVTARRLTDGKLQIEIITTDDNLSRYIDVTRDFSAISQTRPYFSNVEGGLGLLASRNLYKVKAKPDVEFYQAVRTITRYNKLHIVQ